MWHHLQRRQLVHSDMCLMDSRIGVSRPEADKVSWIDQFLGIPTALSRNACSRATSLSLSNLPLCEKCPAPISHFINRRLLSVLRALSLAVNFAGSQYATLQDSIYLFTFSLADYRNKEVKKRCHGSQHLTVKSIFLREWKSPSCTLCSCSDGHGVV